MKNILKIILITSFTILSYSSFSQKNYKESREIQEIKQIIKDNNNNKDNNLLFEGNDNEVIYLPFYFNSNNEFYRILKNQNHEQVFIQSKKFNLSKNDCDFLNRAIINDTNRLYIQKSWFEDKKVIFTTDSSLPWYMKPIFFKNYSRCFIAQYGGGGFSHFLKKINNHWVYDRFYIEWYEH